MTTKVRETEAAYRLAMLTLTPADAALFAEQLVEIQGYSELVDEECTTAAPVASYGHTPMHLERPSSCALEVVTA
jgi:hypothetical protein